MEQKNEMKWTILKSSAQGLLDCLHCYTKSQLLEIASFYGMDGTRYRKHELAEKLEAEILAQMPAVLTGRAGWGKRRHLDIPEKRLAFCIR